MKSVNINGKYGFAFDPAFTDNGYFYVNYVNKDDFTIVSRFRTHDKKNGMPENG